MKSAVILPCYNVEENVEKVILKLISLQKKGVFNEIIAIDDGSKDKTLKILKKYENNNFNIIIHKKNLGKGKAIENGVKLGTKRKINAIVFLDADGEHNPSIIKKSLELLKKYDVVYGSRFRETKNETILVKRLITAEVFACLLERLFDIKTTDPYCGFKAIRTKAYEKINPKEERYNLELEILIKAKLKRLKTKEIKIPLINVIEWKIDFEEEKQNSLSDFAHWIDEQTKIIKKIIKEENYKINIKL